MELSELNSKVTKLRDAVADVIVGLDDVVEMLIVSLVSGGHILLEGSPGLGKTTLAKTFAQTIGGSFKRVQMTADLLPADVLGVNIYNPSDSSWALKRGPIFANVVLVDELNRASPKVQSAFLQAMQERQVTIEGETLSLDSPFLVIATQVPYGAVGTNPLTSVQLDRFSYRVVLGNPEKKAEFEIVNRIDDIESKNVEAVLSQADVEELEKQANLIYVSEFVEEYIVDIVQSLRGDRNVRTGPSPRASIWLKKGARVKALMDGREYVIPDDVKDLLYEVVAHRIELTPQARADEVSVADLIKEVAENVPVPKGIE